MKYRNFCRRHFISRPLFRSFYISAAHVMFSVTTPSRTRLSPLAKLHAIVTAAAMPLLSAASPSLLFILYADAMLLSG